MKLFRDQATILIILFNTENYISGFALADYNRTSLKKLKKDIDYLNEICLNYGCEIISKIGIGYRLAIYNESLYIEFKNNVEKKYYNFMYYRDVQTERIHYIIRLLLNKEYVSTQDLVNKCNYSESTIRRDFPYIKERLERYNLKLINKTNKGLLITGDEWDIRLAFVNEQIIYNDFQKVYFMDDENERYSFLNTTGMIESINKKLKDVLSMYQYIIPFNGLTYVSQMIFTTLKRRKYSCRLKKLEERKIEGLSTERDIICTLFNSIDDDEAYTLDEKEMNYLAAYLKGNKMVKFHEFTQLPIRDEVEKIVDGFFNYSKQYIMFSKWDTTVLKKDLCCEISTMIFKTQAGFHTQLRSVRQFIDDGITNLDLCNLLFQYLKEKTSIDCKPEDVLKLYYCFTYFSRQRDEENKIKIAVVSKSGYFVSRSLAIQYERLTNYKTIEFIPIEYLRLKEMETIDFDGFITDIENFVEEYRDYPVVESHFLRRNKEINSAITQIINSLQVEKNKLFNKNSIHYVDSFKDLKEIENYIRNNVLKDYEDKDNFFEDFYRRNSVYSSRRNNIILMNSIGDCLGREFIEIIALSEPMKFGSDYINKIIIYNTNNNSDLRSSAIRRRVANLLHSYELIFSGDLETDYLMVDRIMYDTSI